MYETENIASNYFSQLHQSVHFQSAFLFAISLYILFGSYAPINIGVATGLLATPLVYSRPSLIRTALYNWEWKLFRLLNLFGLVK